MPAPPKINTYHCPCLSLLLATTHSLSSLPRRSSSSLDGAIIFPLPSSPSLAEDGTLSGEGYTTLINMVKDKRDSIIRRQDGFERRICWRCGRCGVCVGYEIVQEAGVGKLDGGEDRESEGEQVKVLYVLPAGIMSTEFMEKGGGKSIAEGQVEILREGGRTSMAVWD